MSSENGEYLSTEALYNLANETAEVNSVMEVIVYWMSDEEFQIDFAYRPKIERIMQ